MTTAPSASPARIRIQWIDAGKGLAIALVVLFHAARSLEAADFSPEWQSILRAWDSFNLGLETVRMPLFFTLAGLWAGKWIAGSWRALLVNKVALFAWLLLLWPVIRAAGYALGAAVAGQSVYESLVPSLELPTFVLDMQLNAAGNFAVSTVLALVWPSGIRWFLWALAIFFIVAKLIRTWDPRVQLAIAALASLSIFAVKFVLPNYGWESAPKYFMFFLVGVLLKDRLIDPAASITVWRGMAIVAVWLAASVLLAKIDDGLLRWFTCIAGVSSGIVLGTLLSRSGALRYLGRQSLAVYLTHMTVIQVVILLLGAQLAKVPLAVVWVLPLVLTVVAVAASLFMARVAARTPFYWIYELPRSWVNRWQAPRQPPASRRMTAKPTRN